MRIRYIKEDGSGRVEDVDDAVGRRLIASGAAEEVDADEPPSEPVQQPADADQQPATPRKTRRSR